MKKKSQTKLDQLLNDFKGFPVSYDFNSRNISLDHYSNMVYSVIQHKLREYLSFKDRLVITQELKSIVLTKKRPVTLRFFKKYVISLKSKKGDK